MTHTSTITPLLLYQSQPDRGHIIWILPTSSPHPGEPPIRPAAGNWRAVLGTLDSVPSATTAPETVQEIGFTFICQYVQ